MLELTFGADGDLQAVFDGVDMTASTTQGGSDAAPVFTVADIDVDGIGGNDDRVEIEYAINGTPEAKQLGMGYKLNPDYTLTFDFDSATVSLGPDATNEAAVTDSSFVSVEGNTTAYYDITSTDPGFETREGVNTREDLPNLRNFSIASADTDNNRVRGIKAEFVVDPDPPPEEAPVAGDDSYEVLSNKAFTNDTPGILANDSDANGDVLSAVLVNGAENGTVELEPNGSFVYDPDPDYVGSDTFTYKANDGGLDSNVATVSLDVLANRAPNASNDVYQVAADSPFTLGGPGVLGNDSDPDGDDLSAVLVSSPTNGTFSLASDGGFNYEPPAGFVGTNSFRYRASDGDLESSEATVTLIVEPVDLSLADDLIESDMILQRNVPVSIWGRGPPGQTVTVTMSSGETGQATVGADQEWMVTLPPMSATTNENWLGMTVECSDGQERSLSRIAVGEVWLASGQSNMADRFSAIDENLDDPLEHVPDEIYYLDLDGFRMNNRGGWKYLSTDKEHLFSRVATFYGLELYRELGIPVGIIQRYNSGTPIQAWMPYEASEQIRREMKIEENWRDPEDKPPRNPGYQYSDKIEPIVPYTFRGVIWYQGERNAKSYLGWEYRRLLDFMVQTWREVWARESGQPLREYPFYYVQVPTQESQVDDEWAWLRDGMRRALDEIENSGMAVMYDYGPTLHPHDKEPFGKRLSLWALAKDYGQTNMVHCGPLFDGVVFTNGKAVVSFDHVGGGLTNHAGTATLDYFDIAGSDGVYTSATAVIRGDTVVVSNSAVANPAYVRYLHQKAEPVDADFGLMNVEGLPASTFMTDDFLPPRDAYNQGPLAVADHYKLEDSTVLDVAPEGVLDNDSPGTDGTLNAQLTEDAGHGDLSLQADGSFTYTPTNGYTGRDSFSYAAVNASQQSTNRVYITVGSTPDFTSFNDWADYHGVSASEEYLADYAFNIDPDIESRPALPRKSGNSGLPRGRIRRLGEDHLAVEFIRSTAALDLEYRVQFCSDLQSDWADAVTTENVTSESGSWERIVVEDNVPMDEARKRFGRVVVIQE